jgi:transposase
MALDLVSNSLMELDFSVDVTSFRRLLNFTVGAGARISVGRTTAMAKKKLPRTTMDFPIINPDAAGCDIGAESIYVAVPPDRSDEDVRCFRTFTQDLREAAQWLLECGITTIAMESTSVYWIPFAQILEDLGIKVFLVNARHVKNVPAAFKTDRRDSRWLRNLHAVGLLSASFRPDQAVCAVRSIARHRDSLTKEASRCVLHMQKALSQMNILVHEVISDIVGVSGLAILDAILEGSRDPEHLLRLCDARIKASDEDIRKALVGDWREEHLFTLRQSLASWRHFRKLVSECDDEISRMLSQFEPAQAGPVPDEAVPDAAKQTKPQRRGPGAKGTRAKERADRDRLAALFGTDITLIPGIAVGCAQLVFTEVGPDLTRFHSADHFASWLGLVPDNNESGAKYSRAGSAE